MELKLEQQFKKGALEMVLLSLIARQRSYGYELMKALSKASWRQTAAGGSKSIIRLLIWGFPP